MVKIDRCGFYACAWDSDMGVPTAKVVLSMFAPSHGWGDNEGPVPLKLAVVPDFNTPAQQPLHARLLDLCNNMVSHDEPFGFCGGVYQTVPLTWAIRIRIANTVRSRLVSCCWAVLVPCFTVCHHVMCPQFCDLNGWLSHQNGVIQNLNLPVTRHPPETQWESVALHQLPENGQTLARAIDVLRNDGGAAARSTALVNMIAPALGSGQLSPAAMDADQQQPVMSMPVSVRIVSRKPPMPKDFRLLYRTRHTTVFHVGEASRYLQEYAVTIVVFVKVRCVLCGLCVCVVMSCAPHLQTR